MAGIERATIKRPTTDRRPLSRTRSRAVAWASAASAVAAAGVFAAALLMPQETTASSAPAPLHFEGAPTLESVVSDGSADLAATAGLAAPERSVHGATWTFSPEATSIAPEIRATTWEDDLSGHVTRFESIPADDGSSFTVGPSISDRTFPPGQMTSPHPDMPGDSRTEITELLRAYGMPEEAAAFDVVQALATTLEQWNLTNAQHTQMLAIVADAEGAAAVGESVDRFGRPVVGVQVDAADAGSRDVLLISTVTGRIVGVETTALTDSDFLTAGSLAGYRLWDIDVQE